MSLVMMHTSLLASTCTDIQIITRMSLIILHDIILHDTTYSMCTIHTRTVVHRPTFWVLCCEMRLNEIQIRIRIQSLSVHAFFVLLVGNLSLLLSICVHFSAVPTCFSNLFSVLISVLFELCVQAFDLIVHVLVNAHVLLSALLAYYEKSYRDKICWQCQVISFFTFQYFKF